MRVNKKPVFTFKGKIVHKSMLNNDVAHFVFVPMIDDHQVLHVDFYPGQWLDFMRNGLPTTGFSMINSVNTPPLYHENELQFAVKKTDHPMTLFLHDEAQEGDFVDLRGPDGDFVLEQSDLNPATRINLIAGGIGITPLCSMWNYLRNKSDLKSGTFVQLLYSCRVMDDFVFVENFQDVTQEHCQMQANFNLSGRDVDHGKCRQRIPKLTFQPLDSNLLQSTFFSENNPQENREHGIFLLCGPMKMMEDVSRQLSELGVASDRIIYEKW